MNRKQLLTVFVAVLALAWSRLSAADHEGHSRNEPEADPKPYPLGVCVVTGEKLGGDMGQPTTLVYQGREIKLCCGSCRKDFDATPAKFVAKVDAAAKLVKPYSLKTCLVSGEELGEMGKPLVFVQDGQEIRLCCKGCKKDFDKNVTRYLSQLKLSDPDVGAHGHSH